MCRNHIDLFRICAFYVALCLCLSSSLSHLLIHSFQQMRSFNSFHSCVCVCLRFDQQNLCTLHIHPFVIWRIVAAKTNRANLSFHIYDSSAYVWNCYFLTWICSINLNSFTNDRLKGICQLFGSPHLIYVAIIYLHLQRMCPHQEKCTGGGHTISRHFLWHFFCWYFLFHSKWYRYAIEVICKHFQRI